MTRSHATRLGLAAGLAVAALAGAGARAQPEAPSAESRDGIVDCSVEYAAIASAEGYVSAINDVAGSYLAAQRLHRRLRVDPKATSEEVDEAWRAQVGAAQTLLRACRCWEQLDRVGYDQEVLATRDGTTRKQLKARIGEKVAAPCTKVFAAQAADPSASAE